MTEQLTPPGKSPWRRIFWLALLVVYTGVFWGNYVHRFQPTVDPDPDGYVTHARGLQKTHWLISHHRLPGYPLFILLCDVALPGPIATNVYWVQGVLGWGFGLGVLGILSDLRSPSPGGRTSRSAVPVPAPVVEAGMSVCPPVRDSLRSSPERRAEDTPASTTGIPATPGQTADSSTSAPSFDSIETANREVRPPGEEEIMNPGQLLAMGAAVLLVALYSQGSFWGVFTATMMSNFLGSLLAAAVAGGVWLLWERARRPWARGLGLAALMLGIFGSVVVHPVNYMVLGLLVPAIGGAWFLRAFFAKLGGDAWSRVYGRYLPCSVWLWRAALLACVFVASAGSRKLSYALLDRPNPAAGMNGSSERFSNEWLTHQMLLRLPPASDTPVDREIEAMKDQMSKDFGWRVERVAMPPFYPAYQKGRSRIAQQYGVDFSDSRLWKQRLLAHPGAGVHAAVEELLHKYHVLLRQSLPAPFYWDIYPDNNTNPFPPDDNGSLRRRLFWNYGIDLLNYRNVKDDTKDKKVWSKVRIELRYIAVALLLPFVGLGVGLRFSKVPGVFLTGFLWMLGYLAALAFCGFINGRYFLPFFPFLYVLQCLGVAGIVYGAWSLGRWLWTAARLLMKRKPVEAAHSG